MNEIAIGLEGICVAETELSQVDGLGGNLVIRGHRVEDAAQKLRFEEAAALLWTGTASDEYASELGESRVAAHEQILGMRHLLANSHPMDVMRAFIGWLFASRCRIPRICS